MDGFFSEQARERFFVKNIERVQGDERDVIILSVGYHKARDGSLPYRFGPLNQEGGERRLNVAVTRARSRIHIVSSFTHHDMEPGRSSARGVELLRQYLEYAASGGLQLGASPTSIPLNPFELDVQKRLEENGIPLIPQYGVSGYRIDFACAHPNQPGRMVLAIETDGASYHNTPTARDRDRLRQQTLETQGWRFHRIWSTTWQSTQTKKPPGPSEPGSKPSATLTKKAGTTTAAPAGPTHPQDRPPSPAGPPVAHGRRSAPASPSTATAPTS